MDERTKAGFDRVMLGMDDPPAWERLTAGSAQLQPKRRQYRREGLWVAAAAFLVVLVGFGAVSLLLRPGAETASAQLDYLRLEWQEEIILRCKGMEIRDDGGFSEAIIDIWGPSPDDDRYRIEILLPDGSTTTLIFEGSLARPMRAWGVEPAFNLGFRKASCESGNHGWSVSNAPIDFTGLHNYGFTTLIHVVGDQTVDLLEEIQSIDPSPDPATWRGIDVLIYDQVPLTGTDDFGLAVSASREFWLDPEARRLERYILESNSETQGDLVFTMEVTERATVDADTVSFEPEGLTLLLDLTSPSHSEVNDVSTTTSIPLLSQPIMANASRVEAEDLPTPAMVTVASGSTSVWKLDATDAYLILHASSPPLVIAESCDDLVDLEVPDSWQTRCGSSITD